jgi:hypothetical protein
MTALALRCAPPLRHEYVTPAGRLMSDAETAYALALQFDLLPDRGAARAPASAWPRWCRRAAIASAPASWARR